MKQVTKKGTRKTARNMKQAAPKRVKKGTARGRDAIDFLKKDHDYVKQIFDQYRKLVKAKKGSPAEKQRMVQDACDALKVHTQIEEEILYPSLYAKTDKAFMVDEAEVEHDCAKELILQLESMSPTDDFYDAKFVVLGEQVKHHIKEEEDKIFSELKKSGLDLDRMGDALAQRSAALMERLKGGPVRRFIERSDYGRNVARNNLPGRTPQGRNTHGRNTPGDGARA